MHPDQLERRLQERLDARGPAHRGNGSVDEEGKGIEPQDEIEDIPVGDTQNLTVNLAAGSDVLICNIYDEDEYKSHYQERMRVSFTVE